MFASFRYDFAFPRVFFSDSPFGEAKPCFATSEQAYKIYFIPGHDNWSRIIGSGVIVIFIVI